TDGANAEIAAVFSGATVSFYTNGVLLESVACAASDSSSANSLYVQGHNDGRTAGTVQHAYTFNRALTAAEVLDLYRNGVAEADKWGSQTAKYTSDFSAGEDSWTATRGTAAGNIDTIGGLDDWLRFTCDTTPGNTHFLSRTTTISAGKKYRLTFTYYIPSGQSNIDQIAIKELGSSEDVGVALTTLDAATTYSVEWTTGAITGLRISAQDGGTGTFEDAGGDDVFYIKSLSLTEIGATLALEEKGIWLDKWSDSTTNNLVASYPTVGWTLTQQPNKKRVKQPTPTAETTAVTLTIAKLLTGIITATHTAGATQAYTLPTGALTDAWPAFGIDDYFDWYLINLSAAAADTVTVTADTGHTIVGNPIVQSAHASTGGIYGNSAGFRTVKTAASTFITYRIN
ncbi:MAG: hypothetical protein ABIH34_03910, partial [Nanoarchaeota archaeon]